MIAPEIIDHILSFLKSESDYSTLETCSTVFPQIVDRLLYSRICFRTPIFNGEDPKLDDDEGQFYAPPFADFIAKTTQRPCILDSVIHVRVVITVFRARLNNRPVVLLPMISVLLPIFLKLQSIDLRASEAFPWTTLGPDFAAAVQKCLRSPLINQASISNIQGFPLDLFDDCKNLKKLTLNGRFTGSSTTSSSPPLSSLRIVIIDKEPVIPLPKIVSWMNSCTLQFLSLLIYQPRMTLDLRPLIEACSPTLLSLELDTMTSLPRDDHSNLLVNPGDGTTFPVLKSLTLFSFVLFANQHTISFNSNCTSFLAALSRNSSPDSVQLSIVLRSAQMFGTSSVSDWKWADITFLDGLPVFRRPIQLRPASRGSRMFALVLEQCSDLKRLLADGRIKVVDPWE